MKSYLKYVILIFSATAVVAASSVKTDYFTAFFQLLSEGNHYNLLFKLSFKTAALRFCYDLNVL